MFWGIRLLYRMIDQRSLCPTDQRKTHCKTPQAFEEIYAGTPFDLSYKYSYILVVTYVTFLFGAGIPILFPIAYLSLLGFYIVERVMMAYSYRTPPMFGTETNQQTMKALLGAPIFYCCFAAWMYNNQQVFENKVIINDGENFFADSGHKLYDMFTHVTPGMPFAIAVIMLMTIGVSKMLVKLIRRCTGCELTGRKRIMIKDVAQSLDPFFKALSSKQLESFLKEETICRTKIGFNRLTEDSYKDLVHAST